MTVLIITIQLKIKFSVISGTIHTLCNIILITSFSSLLKDARNIDSCFPLVATGGNAPAPDVWKRCL